MNELYDAYFDRFDIVLAHIILEFDYNISGMLQERPSNIRRKMSTGYQVYRIDKDFMSQDLYPMFFGSDNAKCIYHNLVNLYHLPTGEYDARYEVNQ